MDTKEEVKLEEKQKKQEELGQRLANLEFVMFIYFGLGVFLECTGLEGPLGFLATIYLFTFQFALIIYLVMGCFYYKHKSIIMNIIDGVLGFAVGMFNIALWVYGYSKSLYYCLGGIFSFLPIVFSFIDNKKLEGMSVLKMVNRILMIMFVVLAIMFMSSCGANIQG